MQQMSKSQFKPKAFEVMRLIEKTGKAIILTDHGQPVLELKVYRPQPKQEGDSLVKLKGSVLKYENPTLPVSETDWEVLK